MSPTYVIVRGFGSGLMLSGLLSFVLLNVPEHALSLLSDLVFAVAKIGRLSTKNAVLFLCDMQEKFRPNIFQFTNIVSNAARLLQVRNAHMNSTSHTSLCVLQAQIA